MLATKIGDIDSVKILLNGCADPNTQTKVHKYYNFVHSYTTLRERGSWVHIVAQNTGWSALLYAASQGNIEIVSLLIEHGAIVKLKDKVS